MFRSMNWLAPALCLAMPLAAFAQEKAPADEETDKGGGDAGPGPHELLLARCTVRSSARW